MTPEVLPFEIAVDDELLTDLRERLHRTRWPERETVGDWSQGVPLSYAQELCRYWADEYNWRARETALNRFPQFRTKVDGLGIHFLHVRSPSPEAIPLVLTHGWPGSFVEFQKVIEPLTNPSAYGGSASDAFHVVCPSLPGYGWSDRPTSAGWTVQRIADAWDTLMTRLGYNHYGSQGGDWGATISLCLGSQHPDRVIGAHVNLMAVEPDPATLDSLTDDERASIESGDHYARWDSGYSKLQSTRPQTLGFGLVDSPAAQCTWIIEKFWSWTDCDGHPENAIPRDELLDNVMVYWATATGASAARLYWESMRSARQSVPVPTGCTIFPKEITRPSRRWAEQRLKDLRYWNEVERGGHFAAFEQPEIFVEEVRRFFRLVR
jgi:pimeloyl-ACP methyl ester carboxylesterase